MKARISAVMICTSSLLLADAAAAGQFASPGRTPPQLLLASSSLEFPRQQNAASPSSLNLRLRGSGRHRTTSQGTFTGSSPVGVILAAGMSGHSNKSNAFAFDKPPASGTFHFQHAGGDVTKEVPRSYNRMCDTLSSHIWNEPDGRRLKFDLNGKPGIAIEIPFK